MQNFIVGFVYENNRSAETRNCTQTITLSHNGLYLCTGIENLHSVACIIQNGMSHESVKK